MSTRATIRIAKREEGVSFNEHTEDYHTQIYHHYDGYPDFLGVALAEFFDGFGVTNGNGPERSANGLGCLSAQLVAGLKEEPGRIYIDYVGQDRFDIEYIYYIWGTEDKDIWMRVFDRHDKCIFVGTPQKLIEKYQ